NEKDKFKYSNIEKLIGMEINKLTIPESIGEAPTFSSSKRNDFDNKERSKKSHEKSSHQKSKFPKREKTGAKFTAHKQDKPVRENIKDPQSERVTHKDQ